MSTHNVAVGVFALSVAVAALAAIGGRGEADAPIEEAEYAAPAPFTAEESHGRAYSAGQVTPLLAETRNSPNVTQPGDAPVPVGLKIDRIRMNSQLIGLGLTESGELAVPAGEYYNYPGWYAQGAAPGEQGPAVIAGHLDSESSPSVFHRLGELAPGDVIEIDRADGSVIFFTVDRVGQYSKDNFPTEAVYGPTSKPELRLITCGGGFNRRDASYRDNVVIFASESSR
ncbi:MAG: class F sortase [Acidimicrobiales bacterium]